MIALLTSDSRESLNKATQLKNASLSLNLKCDVFYNNDFNKEDYKIIIPCSDKFGDNGNLVSKANTYNLVSKCGFDILPFEVIKTVNDLDNSKIDGEIFVKPDTSSGVHSVHEWGYKKFSSTKHFKEHLIKTNNVISFNGSLVNYIIMPFVEHEGVYTFSVIQRDDCVSVFAKMYMAISEGGSFYDYSYYEDYKINTEPCNNFWKLGLTNNLIYIQTIKHKNKFYPIDINCRLSTYLDTIATHYDKDFYIRLLKFLLKETNSLDIKLPSKKFLIGRILSNPFKEIQNLKWKSIKDVDALNFNNLSLPNANYDKAYSWLTYACKGESKQEIFDKRKEFLSNVNFNQ